MSQAIPSSEPITAAIARLRDLTQCSIQAHWHTWDGDLPLAEALDSTNWQTWAIAPLNARNHVAWSKGQNVRWLTQMIVVPEDLQGYPLVGMTLRLALTWWAEVAQIFLNGALVQEGDLFDCSTRLLLGNAVQPGNTFAIALRLVSPGHDDGALVRSICLYESLTTDTPEPGFIADELAVLHTYLQTLAPEKLDRLTGAIAQLDWQTVADKPTFAAALTQLRTTLAPLSPLLKQRTIHLVGHAHLDMAWLWAVAETWNAAERTFRSVLALQQDFPELTFCHSTPALYDWIEQHRPALFHQIQHQVKTGTWEPIGGMWVEPELNIISGESIVRHILYGQRYFQEKFGATSAIAWLPDSFGFNWQLPQLLKQGGIDYFVTQKLRWNDTTQFPYDLFQWQAPDGTPILSLMSAPIGEGIDPVKMATYACTWETKTGIPTSLWLPGVGDHGGGPTRDMLELTRRWQQSLFFPTLKFTTVLNYLQTLPSSSPSTPTWHSDLYLEFHRGCYTTHADQKVYNRRLEELLYQAELWATIASIQTGTAYPKAELETAWKKVLFNQFHDILPGSSIPPVFEDANQDWEAAEDLGEDMLQRSLTTLARHITLPDQPQPGMHPILVFNARNWKRSAILELPVPETANVQGVYDADGEAVPYERSAMGSWLWQADNLPPVGYRLFWISYTTQSKVTFPAIAPSDEFILENQFLRVVVDPATGDLASVFDKTQQWEVLGGAGNQLQAFTDQGQYWDAWNIDPNYAQFPLPAATLQNIEWLERGTLRSRIVVIRTLGESTFCQEYVLEAGSPVLKIETHVDWQERHVLVKAAFPLNLTADYATCEIPCGAIQRPTKPQTEAEKAMWEVPALHWVDLADGTRGASLLNDCKYGYDFQPHQIRLTLLRSTDWPHPGADRGYHRFTYALYPHAGNWQMAQTVRQGYALNSPLHVVSVEQQRQGAIAHSLPPNHCFLDLTAENLVLMAFKPAETDSDQWILRCYECHGNQTPLLFQNTLNLQLTTPVDLLERTSDHSLLQPQTTLIPAWRVATFAVSAIGRDNKATHS